MLLQHTNAASAILCQVHVHAAKQAGDFLIVYLAY